MAKEKQEVIGTVIKLYGIISETETTEKILAEVSWNNRPSKLEIRNRDKETGRLLRGIAITFDEIAVLYSLITAEHVVNRMDIEDHERESVDLDDMLSGAARIKEIRNEYATKDGLIMLHRTSMIEFYSNGKIEFVSVYEFNRKRAS